LRLILRRMRQRPFVLEHLSKIAAINPPAAGRAPNEMLGLIRGRLSDALAIVAFMGFPCQRTAERAP
jgi:hypothetical protein